MVNLRKWARDRREDLVDVFDANTQADQQRRLAAGQPRWHQDQNQDNRPGFQINNNSLTRGVSRGVDQVNPVDSGRTWKERSANANEALSIAQQAQRRASGARDKLDTGGRSNLEQLQRIPGSATSMATRIPQGLFGGAEVVGKGFQRTGNILLPGSPFKDRSTKSYIPQLYKGAGQQADFAERKIAESRFGAKEGDNIVGSAADVAGSVAGYAALNLAAGGAGAVPSGLNVLGRESDKSVQAGRSISEATLRQAPGAIGQAALEKFGYGKLMKPFGGAVIPRVGSRMVTEGTQEGLQELTSNVSAKLDYDPNRSVFQNVPQAALVGAVAGGAMAIPLEVAQNPRGTQQAAQQVISNVKKAASPQVAAIDEQIALLEKARANSPSPQAQARFGRAIDGLIQERVKATQGGFVRLPGGDKDVAPDLGAAQKMFINNYAEMLEGMSKDGGVNVLPDGTRASSNSPFYRQVFAEKGRAPTKTEWFEEARRQIESGQAAFGASDDYRALSGSPSSSSPETQPTSQSTETIKQQTQIPQKESTPQSSQSPLLNDTTTDPETESLFQSASEQKVLKPDQSDKIADALEVPEEMRTQAPDPRPREEVDAEMAEIMEPKFDAVAGRAGSKSSNELVAAIQKDKQLTEAAEQAQSDGSELHYFAKKDENGRSVGIERFNPKEHRIEVGFVVDVDSNVLGNHIKVDKTGIQVNVGGELVNMESVLGNPNTWGSKGKYKLSETMNRNIDNNAPNKQIAENTKQYLWAHKVQAEANLRTELEAEYTKLGERVKAVKAVRPKGTSKERFEADIFELLNGDKDSAEIQKLYKPEVAEAILRYKSETRSLYNSLLERINAERVKFGQEPIEPRENYITHLQEMNQNKGFVTEVYGQMKNSFADEGMAKTRGGVPGTIAGRTENFKPIAKYNPFLQRRTGTTSLKDPFLAVQEYLQPALYNIHMTETGARARAVEAAFRTAEQMRQTNPDKVIKQANDILDLYKKGGDNAKLVTGFQEYANAIAGKTQRFDRQAIDASDASAMALKGWQGLQRIGGRGTILGNLSSVLAQPLNQVVGLADAGPANYMKGIAHSLVDRGPIEKSDFVRARSTEPTKVMRSTGSKVTDSGARLLQAVELASVKLMWQTQYQKALGRGYKGQKAIQQADLNTERLVAGRGIADKPEAYRSTAINGLLQYTLEVNAQNKAFWQDLTLKQKATFMVAATATNTLMALVTGYEPLPDFLKAAYQTGDDFLDEEDDRSGLEKAGGGVQRMLDQYASMNPLVSAPANALPQNVRKAVFGTNSDLGRFEGGAAPIGVIKNTVNAASDAIKGNYRESFDDAIRNVPFGNQIRKTVGGAELLIKGQKEDKDGNVEYEAPSSALGAAQVLAFGPSASRNAQQYFDDKDAGLSKDQREMLRDLPEDQKAAYKEQLFAQNKSDDKQKEETDKAKEDTTSTTSKVDEIEKQTEERSKQLKATMSPDDWKIYNMTEEEKKKVVEAGIKTQEELEGLEKYGDERKRELGYKMADSNLPDNLHQKARSILENPDRNNDEWLTGQSDEEVKKTIHSWVNKDVEKPPVNNQVAKRWAELEKKRAEGTLGTLEEQTEKKSILKEAYNSQLSEDERDLYSLSEAKLQSALDSGVISESNIQKALAVEKQLFDAGLIDRETLARKLDLDARGYKSRKGGKGRKPSIKAVIDSLKQPELKPIKQTSIKVAAPKVPNFKTKTPAPKRKKRAPSKLVVKKTSIA